MEKEVLKSREDFETESDWWTYQVIHAEEFEALEQQEIIKYPYDIIQCKVCGEIIDENETKPDITLPYELRFKCKCGNKELTKFRHISEMEKNKIIKNKATNNKKNNTLSDYRIKRLTKRVEIDLEKIKDDLTQDLEDGRISPERYVVVMLNLFAREFEYYSKTIGNKFDWKNFRDTSLEIAKSQLEKKYENELLDEKLTKAAIDYEEEKDTYYLEKYQIMLNGRMQDEEDKGRIEELDREIKRVERQKKIALDYQEKRNNSKKLTIERYTEKADDDAIWNFEKNFKKDLKKLTNINKSRLNK